MKNRKKNNDNNISEYQEFEPAITEEDLRQQIETLRLSMEKFSGESYATFEDAYRDLFGEGLEPEQPEQPEVPATPVAEEAKPSPAPVEQAENEEEEGVIRSTFLEVIPLGRTKPVKVKVYTISESDDGKHSKKTLIALGTPDGKTLYRSEERADEMGDAVWLKIDAIKDKLVPNRSQQTIYLATSEKYADYE